ncbi:hypothetical protein F0249_17210 [Vibrio sp. 03-59-1]|uniref:phage tail protein n=1 Tax=Vibrio sp. 03-59-1 TaxID=2607607 RepID=UPI00149349FB|nr:tail fiber protein [Vibrio sp. 03-59-1]NOH85537.1 hypothetical protein [Vibrio sp. 03-59-1]
MPQLTLDELEALDLRGYVTQLGFNAEANAKTFGNKIKITKIQVDGGLLPIERSPVSVENVVHDYGDESIFDAVVNEDAAGVMTAQISIPVSHAINGGSYEIWGLAVIAELDGVEFIYSYRRIEGDVKLFNSDSLKSYLFRVTWQTSNASVIEYVIAPSIAYVTHKEMSEHENKDDAHSQYERKDNAATNDDIDNKSTAEKHIKLPQLFRAFLGFITNQWNGDKTDIAVSQKGVTDGLATKIDKTSITDSINSTSSVLVASAKAIKTVKDIANEKWTYVTATTGRYGATLLSNSYTGTSQTKAVTEKALSEGLEAMAAKKYKMVSMVGNGMVPKTYTPDSGDTGQYAYGILVSDAAMGSTGIIRINAKTGQWCKFHHIMMGQYANTVFITKLIIDGTVVSQGQNLGFDRSEEASRDNSFNLFMTMYWRTIEIHWKAVESSPSYNDILAGWADYEVGS